jgi:ribonucleoside-diphosphate reductase alpha chain
MADAGGGGLQSVEIESVSVEAISVEATVARSVDNQLDQMREARMKGYEGDACGDCGNFTLVRNGTCLKCNTCGATSGCS